MKPRTRAGIGELHYPQKFHPTLISWLGLPTLAQERPAGSSWFIPTVSERVRDHFNMVWTLLPSLTHSISFSLMSPYLQLPQSSLWHLIILWHHQYEGLPRDSSPNTIDLITFVVRWWYTLSTWPNQCSTPFPFQPYMYRFLPDSGFARHSKPILLSPSLIPHVSTHSQQLLFIHTSRCPQAWSFFHQHTLQIFICLILILCTMYISQFLHWSHMQLQECETVNCFQ